MILHRTQKYIFIVQVDKHRLWSSIANVKEPEVVVQAHLNFINAGADIIITNSYQSNPIMLREELNINEVDAKKYLLGTVQNFRKKFHLNDKNT